MSSLRDLRAILTPGPRVETRDFWRRENQGNRVEFADSSAKSRTDTLRALGLGKERLRMLRGFPVRSLRGPKQYYKYLTSRAAEGRARHHQETRGSRAKGEAGVRGRHRALPCRAVARKSWLGRRRQRKVLRCLSRIPCAFALPSALLNWFRSHGLGRSSRKLLSTFDASPDTAWLPAQYSVGDVAFR